MSTTTRIGVCHQIPHYGLHADRLPWACYLRPAAFSRTYSVASSWTHPVPALSHCPRPASLLLLFPCAFAPDHWNPLRSTDGQGQGQRERDNGQETVFLCGLISRKMAISGGKHMTLAQALRDVT